MGIFSRFNRLRSKKSDSKKEEPIYTSSKKQAEDRHLLALSNGLNINTKKRKATDQAELTKRIGKKKLNLAYRIDEVASRCVEYYVDQVTSPGFELVGNPKAVEICENVSRNANLLLKIKELVRDGCIYGNGFAEKIKNMDDHPVGLERINPIKIDYQRQGMDIIEDQSGNPIGYSFTKNNGEKVKFDPSEILHYKMISTGNEMALGFIELAFRIIYLKLNIRQGFAQAGYRMGHPLRIIYAGDKPDIKNSYQGHKANKKIIDKLADEFEDLETKHKFVVPFWTKVEQLPATETPQTELLEYCDKRIAAAFGIPLGIALGTKSGADIDPKIKRVLDRKIKGMQNDLSYLLEHEFFAEVCKQNNIKDVPQVKWKEITPEDKNRMAKRFVEYVEAGILTPEDVKEEVLKNEGLEVSSQKTKKRGIEKVDKS